jgi:hypothetical protein
MYSDRGTMVPVRTGRSKQLRASAVLPASFFQQQLALEPVDFCLSDALVLELHGRKGFGQCSEGFIYPTLA